MLGGCPLEQVAVRRPAADNVAEATGNLVGPLLTQLPRRLVMHTAHVSQQVAHHHSSHEGTGPSRSTDSAASRSRSPSLRTAAMYS